MTPESDLGKGPEASPHRIEALEANIELPIHEIPGTPEEKDLHWFNNY